MSQYQIKQKFGRLVVNLRLRIMQVTWLIMSKGAL
jgi:hypothetical protein